MTSLEELIHLQCNLFRKKSLFCSILIRSPRQSTIKHTKLSGRPYVGGENNYGVGWAWEWTYEALTVPYIVVVPVGIFPGVKGGGATTL